jgi:parallel beta-helix repeat protein
VTINSGLDIEPDGLQVVTNVSISGCSFLDNYGCGLSVYGAGGLGAEQVRNVLIDNNTFNNNCIYGLSVSSTLKASLELTETFKASVTNNSITDLNRRGGIYCDINRETVIQNNDITGEAATATTPQNVAFLSGLVVNSCVRMVVSNNSVRTSNYHGIYLYQSTNCIVSTNVADNCLIHGLVSQSNDDCIISTNILSEIQQIGLLSLNDDYTQFLNNTIINNNLAGYVTTNVSGASIRVTFSLANTPLNIKVMGNTVRTSTTTPTYPLIIGGANVISCVACPNDFRGTFVNGVTDTGTATILSQANVINLT